MINSIQDFKEQIKWNPTYEGYGRKVGKIFQYEKNWYCKENFMIHNNLKQVLSCKDCCSLTEREKNICKRILKWCQNPKWSRS